ncbi:pregnancy-specific glycoprotein 22-like [Misgurnus anguillicaudatus]|uniref:pregnancy-specific glycoprotein 22-like n=1 Tax=Misgurnus anguillicaudatus TaxID=75329 RepID=UPI003CCF43F5
MLIIFVLMLVLFQAGSCVDQICSFMQTKPCYAALGDKLSLRMFQDIHIIKLELKKEESLICKIQNNVVIKFHFYSNRSDVIGNDTVIINSVTRADSGRYTLMLIDSLGKEIPTQGLQVNVEAPIGSVKVSVECISGVSWAHCSSDGDSLFFNWTLNGQPLPQENKTTINLDKETSGNLICSVKNHISHGENSTNVNYCPGEL